MNPDKLNPAEQTAAEADYEKKFNRDAGADTKELKEKESAPNVEWKTVTKKKSADEESKKKGRFRFFGRKSGVLRNGSALTFIVVMIGLGVAYTSIFTPNIILVNMKEMYTNDLADATDALNAYYWKMMNYKIGRSQCSGTGTTENPEGDIKCKLSTMSSAQVDAFKKYGFTVLGTQIQGTGTLSSSASGDSQSSDNRYQVTAILPPAYKATIDNLKGTGTNILTNIASGNIGNLGNVLSSGLGGITQDALPTDAQSLLKYSPIATGDMLWLYAQLSLQNKSQVYGVFNPKSSFFQDTRFKTRIKDKYGLTRQFSVSGTTEQEVNQSFDAAVKGSGSVNLAGQPDGGLGLANLGDPTTIAKMEIPAMTLATESTSFAGLQCSWYAYGKEVMNNAKSAKAVTLARYAMQYLQAADQIKIGTADAGTIGVLSSKLAQSASGGYTGQNATDSSMYKSITYGSLAIPDGYGFLYSEDTFDLIGALIPAWSQIMASATAEGAASGITGTLAMPPANLTGSDRDYCLAGETAQNHQTIKSDTETKCAAQITASAPSGWQATLEAQIALGRTSCVVPHYDDQDNTYEGADLTQPTLKSTSTQLTPYVGGLFGVNVAIWANAISLLFSSNTKGIPASDAIFAGTGEILGDMAQSRGMEPANAATMGVYIAQQNSVNSEYDQLARYQAQKTPFDIYNKFSFLGSIVHNLTPSYSSDTPVFSSLSNGFSLLTNSVTSLLGPDANAFYYLQPEYPNIDVTNPASAAQHAAGLAQYLTRMNCPDPEYLAIGIMADSMCNVRYVMGKQELAAQPDSVLDYMLQSHSDLTQKNIDELTERQAQADPEVDQANIARMLATTTAAATQPEIDKTTGKAIAGSEYEKYLDYCVNRVQPWGRSDIVVQTKGLSQQEEQKRLQDKDQDGNAISPSDSGDPYEKTIVGIYPAVSEGSSQDQDWYSGKKCLEQSEELMNFRAYTMMCSVDGSLSGGVDCSDTDNSNAASYSDNFFTSNDILYDSWN